MKCFADNPEEIREVRSLDIASGACSGSGSLAVIHHSTTPAARPRLVLLSRPLRRGSACGKFLKGLL
jgi:hypothetical protein